MISISLKSQKLANGSLQLKLSAPFHPSLAPRCREIGGRWHPETKTWRFDPRDEQRVRNICIEIFGVDPYEPPGSLMTVRVPLNGESVGELWLGGRCVAKRPERDCHVVLGDGVVVVDGGFPSSGGSRANPALNPKENTVLEIRDLPPAAADKILESRPAAGVVSETPVPIGRPVGPPIDSIGADPPAVAAIVEGFSALSATHQALVLKRLAEILPQAGVLEEATA